MLKVVASVRERPQNYHVPAGFQGFSACDRLAPWDTCRLLLWVKVRPSGVVAACPPYPQQRTARLHDLPYSDFTPRRRARPLSSPAPPRAPSWPKSTRGQICPAGGLFTEGARPTHRADRHQGGAGSVPAQRRADEIRAGNPPVHRRRPAKPFAAIKFCTLTLGRRRASWPRYRFKIKKRTRRPPRRSTRTSTEGSTA
jgi:hypothetical protein